MAYVIKKNHADFGQFVKECREAAGLTQKQLADAIGFEYYGMISHVEKGRSTLPTAHWRKTAEILRIDLPEFLVKCLSDITPDVRDALFGDASDEKIVELLKKF